MADGYRIVLNSKEKETKCLNDFVCFKFVKVSLMLYPLQWSCFLSQVWFLEYVFLEQPETTLNRIHKHQILTTNKIWICPDARGCSGYSNQIFTFVCIKANKDIIKSIGTEVKGSKKSTNGYWSRPRDRYICDVQTCKTDLPTCKQQSRQSSACSLNIAQVGFT